MERYEQAVLDQIEAGLALQGWKPGFEKLDGHPAYVRRPILFACLIWGVATVVTTLLLGLSLS